MPFYRDNSKTGVREELDNLTVGIILFGATAFGFLVGCVFILSR